ncbi:MAG: hypothetical protein OXF44_07615 [Anaerolineaceae bacterium]|nr:hypothetical protein [Anaerolineaceae bacterium]
MSEYVTVESEPGEEADLVEIYTNQRLTAAGREFYADLGAGETGSTLAQTLYDNVPGIAELTIEEDSLLVRYLPEFTQEEIVDALRAALRDFFL